MKTRTTPKNLGVVAAIRGSVVEIWFDQHLPPIYSLLHAGEEGRTVIEVLAQSDAQHVRGIFRNGHQGHRSELDCGMWWKPSVPAWPPCWMGRWIWTPRQRRRRKRARPAE
jgi:F-type H+-transporting ATPase subunit beta